MMMLIPITVMAQSEQSIVEGYKARYKDFFARLEAEKRREARRAQGRNDIKEQRKRNAIRQEAARKKFVLERKPPKDLSEEFRDHEEKLKRDRLRYLEIQESYAKKQRRIEAVREGAIKIPPVIEFGLQEAL